MCIEASHRRVTPGEFEKLHSDGVHASVYFEDDLETDEEIHSYFEANVIEHVNASDGTEMYRSKLESIDRR